jgi:hypothetical protein
MVMGWLGADISVCTPPDPCKVVEARLNQAPHIIPQVASVVGCFHPESGGTPWRPDRTRGPILPKCRPSQPRATRPAISVRGMSVGGMPVTLGITSLTLLWCSSVFPATRLLRSVLSPPRSGFLTLAAGGPRTLLRSEIIVRMWQICIGEQAGLAYLSYCLSLPRRGLGDLAVAARKACAPMLHGERFVRANWQMANASASKAVHGMSIA